MNIRTKKGFTLIELLVVISIIAILMAIMMPALTMARNQAKRTVCTSNMHQWAVACQSYCIDNKDQFPARFSPNDGKRNHNALIYYYVKQGSYTRINLLDIFVIPYLGDSKSADCPSNPNQVLSWDEQKEATKSASAQTVSGDYGLYVGYDKNLGYIAWGPGPDFNLNPTASRDAFVPPFKSSISPSTMAITGCMVYNYYSTDRNWYYYHPYGKDATNPPDGAPAAYVDGSANYSKYNDMVIYQRYINHPQSIQFWWPDPKK